MGQTNPCTIFEAIQLLPHQHISKKQSQHSVDDNRDINHGKNRPTSVDIVAVVVEVSTCVDKQLAEIWIADGSLTKPVPFVTFTRSSSNNKLMNAVAEGEIAIGDVMRFNRVALKVRTDRTVNSTNWNIAHEAKTFQHKTTNLRVENVAFCQSWDNPEASNNYYCVLCRIFLNGSSIYDIATKFPLNVPQIMETDADRVHDLVEWYQRSNYFVQQLQHETKAISSFPCRRRLINEIISTVGSISNLVAKVLTHEKFNQHESFKRKNNKQQRLNHKLAFATLSDGKDIITFIDGNSIASCFHKIMKAAVETSEAIMLTNVLSKKGKDILWLKGRPRQYGDDEVFLIPTSNTQSILLPPNTSLVNYHDAEEEVPLSLTQPQSWTRQKEEEVDSGQIVSITESSAAITPLTNISAVEASLHDIIFHDLGLSLKQCEHVVFKSTKNFTAIFFDNDEYREAIISLNTCVMKHIENDTPSEKITLFADKECMQTLCGGLIAKELIDHISLQQDVLNLLQCFLRDDVILHWSYQDDDNNQFLKFKDSGKSLNICSKVRLPGI